MTSLDPNTVNSDLSSWIDNFLSVQHPAFNNLPPCVYAKTAWKKNQVVVILDSTDLSPDSLGTKEVAVYVYSPESISSASLTKLAEQFNQCYPDFVALEDHPDDPEIVDTVKLNNQKYALIFVQPKNKLNEARTYLQSKNYYKNWTAEYYHSVVGNVL